MRCKFNLVVLRVLTVRLLASNGLGSYHKLIVFGFVFLTAS